MPTSINNGGASVTCNPDGSIAVTLATGRQVDVITATMGTDSVYTERHGLVLDQRHTANAPTQTDLYGATFTSSTYGTGDFAYGAQALSCSAVAHNTGHCHYLYGLSAAAGNRGASLLDELYAAWISSQTQSGHTAKTYGLFVTHYQLGGTSAERYGVYVDQCHGGALDGIAVNVGLYIADQSPVGTAAHYNLYSQGAGSLNHFEGQVTALGGASTRVKAGPPTDADFAQPVNGLTAGDSTSGKFYMRLGGVWRSVTLS